jgi:hypothetical protein
LQYLSNLRNLDKPLHLLDLLVLAPKQHKLFFKVLDLLGKVVQLLLSLVGPKEVGIKALINLSLFIYP